MSDLVSLFNSRDLFILWTLREIRVRYKQSLLGVAWAILQPLSLMLIFTVVFGLFVKVPTDGIPYPIFSYCALLPWTLFSTSISFAVPSLVNNMNLVTKVYFPREILPLASIGAACVDYLVASGLFLVLMFLYQVPLFATLVFLPLLFLVQLVLTTGLALLTSALTVLYRDVRFIVPLALQVLMYLCPIVYPLSLVPERLRGFYFLNPMAGLIDGYRRVTLYGQPPTWDAVGMAAVVSVLMFALGYYYFKHSEAAFADII